jgi:hypothetical protein
MSMTSRQQAFGAPVHSSYDELTKVLLTGIQFYLQGVPSLAKGH